MIAVLLLAVLAIPLLVSGQTPESHAVPSLEVDFAADGGTPISFPSVVMAQLPVCYSSKSCSALLSVEPHTMARLVAAHFDLSGQDRSVDPSAIESLSYLQATSSSPTEHGLIVVVHGAASDTALGARLVPKAGSEPDHSNLKQGYYLCLFDDDGKPQGVHLLDSRFRTPRAAYLGSDQILLLGFDNRNEKPALAVLDRSGNIVQFLDDQGSLPGGDELLKRSGVKIDDAAPQFAKQIFMAQEVTSWKFGYAGNRLLLLQPGTQAVVWSISPGGEIRKVKLRMPPGTTASTVVSSDHSWLIRSFVATDPDAGLLFEFDPETGEALRRIDTKLVPPTSVFYEAGGIYYALWWDKNHQSFILKSK